MTKTAAKKLLDTIYANRANAILKQAYELGVAKHASLYGCDDKTCVQVAKTASSWLEAQDRASTARKAEIARAILSHLK